jgi:hypothetical protein
MAKASCAYSTPALIAPLSRGGGVDLSAAAKGYIDDAAELGMRFVMGPDGNFWRVTPVGGSDKAHEAREEHWGRLGNRPRLMRAVYAAVESGASRDV